MEKPQRHYLLYDCAICNYERVRTLSFSHIHPYIEGGEVRAFFNVCKYCEPTLNEHEQQTLTALYIIKYL